MNLIGYSAPLSQKTFLADEISQKLNNPVSPYIMWNDRFHVSVEKQDNRICIYNVTKNSSDLCICSFFNLLSQFTIVQTGDMLYQREISNSLYLFPQVVSFSS